VGAEEAELEQPELEEVEYRSSRSVWLLMLLEGLLLAAMALSLIPGLACLKRRVLSLARPRRLGVLQPQEDCQRYHWRVQPGQQAKRRLVLEALRPVACWQPRESLAESAPSPPSFLPPSVESIRLSLASPQSICSDPQETRWLQQTRCFGLKPASEFSSAGTPPPLSPDPSALRLGY